MYVNKGGHVLPIGSLVEQDGASTGVTGISFLVFSRIQVKRLVAIVSTVLSSTGAGVVTFRLRPTYGSSGSQSTLGTITIGSSAGVGAVGSAWYKNITPVTVNPGSQIVTDYTTAFTTSGKCFFGFEWEDSPEEAKDLTAMNAG